MLHDAEIQLAPIRGADLANVGAFLHAHLNPRLSAREWADSMVPTWRVCAPNYGFLLRTKDRLVGVQLAFYSERAVDNQVAAFCNLGAWCVLEEYRSQGVRLLRAVLPSRATTSLISRRAATSYRSTRSSASRRWTPRQRSSRTSRWRSGAASA